MLAAWLPWIGHRTWHYGAIGSRLTRTRWRAERNTKIEIAKSPLPLRAFHYFVDHLHSYIKISDRCSRAIERIRFSSGMTEDSLSMLIIESGKLMTNR